MGALRDQGSPLGQTLEQGSILRGIQGVEAAGEHSNTDSPAVDCPAMGISGDPSAPAGNDGHSTAQGNISQCESCLAPSASGSVAAHECDTLGVITLVEAPLHPQSGGGMISEIL
jgi:hypothetical protein